MWVSRATDEEQEQLEHRLIEPEVQARLFVYPPQTLDDPEIRPDLALVTKTRDWIVEQARFDDDAREWRQEVWFQAGEEGSLSRDELVELNKDGSLNVCNTHACVAGHVASMFGEPLVGLGGTLLDVVRNDADGKIYRMSNLATRKLGLHESVASLLFEADNTAEDVIAILDRVIEAENVRNQNA